jgi:hypothetical protein
VLRWCKFSKNLQHYKYGEFEMAKKKQKPKAKGIRPLMTALVYQTHTSDGEKARSM